MSRRVSPSVDPDKSSHGLYDMATVLVNKFNVAVKGSAFQGIFTDEEMAGLLAENFGTSMLNALIKTDMGQGIIVGYLIGIMEVADDDEEAEEAADSDTD